MRRAVIAVAVMTIAGCSGTTAPKPSVPPASAGSRTHARPRLASEPGQTHDAADANRACHDAHPHPLRVSDAAPGTVALRGGPHANVRVVTSKPVVGLSFDDGPTTAYTPRVLNMLARAGAHATFFDIGRFANRHPALVAREVRAHDEVANHTYTHIQLAREGAHGAIRLARRAITREIALTRIVLCHAGAQDPKLFRPPYGRGVFALEIDALAADQGERVVGWDLALDHFIDNRRALRVSVAALLGRVRPGSIILAHDGPALRERTIAALPSLLRGLRRLGYRVVTITDLLRSGAVVRSG